ARGGQHLEQLAVCWHLLAVDQLPVDAAYPGVGGEGRAVLPAQALRTGQVVDVMVRDQDQRDRRAQLADGIDDAIDVDRVVRAGVDDCQLALADEVGIGAGTSVWPRVGSQQLVDAGRYQHSATSGGMMKRGGSARSSSRGRTVITGLLAAWAQRVSSVGKAARRCRWARVAKTSGNSPAAWPRSATLGATHRPSVVSIAQCSASWQGGIWARKKRVLNRRGRESGVIQWAQ